MARSVGIVGGGLIGLATAHRLAQAGVPVTVYESGRRVGGLAASANVGGVAVDRFYHVILPTDDRVRGLAEELGLGDAFRFRTTRVGFYHAGELASMSSLKEFATFPALRLRDRVRLAAFVAGCQLQRSHERLDETPIEAWLRRRSGDRVFEQLWRPLLASKFDGVFDDLPATYLWSRTRRMSKTRDAAAREVMGTLEGGYQRLADALADAIRAHGGEVLVRTPVRAIPAAGGRPAGVLLDDGLRRHDHVVTTQLRPVVDGLLAPELRDRLAPDPCRYLGVVCVVARVRKPVSPFYSLNITDRRVPLTTVVESTHVVDPEQVEGTLLYVPRYVRPESPELDRPSDEIVAEYLGHVRTMFPAFDLEADLIAARVARARIAEPVHVAGAHERVPDLFPVPGLAVASSAHMYPELVNGQAVLGVAEQLSAGLLERVRGERALPEAA